MPIVNSHIVLNWKAYLRFLIAAVFPTILLFRFSETYTLLLFSIVFFILIFELFKQNHPKNQIESCAYYLLWIIVFLTVILSQKLRFNLLGSDSEQPFFHYPIKEIIIVKLTVFIISLIRHKSILVTSTILSKLWLIVMFSHFAVLFLNSTYSFNISAYHLAIVSAIETTLIIFVEEKLLVYKSSIFDFLWKKN